jgi:CheY-like chemotaxis protein
MPTILVVDDEPSVRRAVHRVLASGGMTVVESGSATDALGVIGGTQRIDAVVCDVLMPGISGLAFYDALVKQAPELRHRVVFLTGLAHDPNVHDPIEQRGVPLVSKLDDLRLVGDAVRVALLRPVPAPPA